MTKWETIERQGMVYIKGDLRLERLLWQRPAVFFNTMKYYMLAAIPKFNRPPEMMEVLGRCTLPEFQDITEKTVRAWEAGETFTTGYTGYDVCSVGILSEDAYGDVAYTRVAVEYDAVTGVVTLEERIEAGALVVGELYRDGWFDSDLNHTEIDILAFALFDVWEHRFDADALMRGMKVKDSGFSTVSEAQYANAGTNRLQEIDRQLWGMIRAYADNVEYRRAMEG